MGFDIIKHLGNFVDRVVDLGMSENKTDRCKKCGAKVADDSKCLNCGEYNYSDEYDIP